MKIGDYIRTDDGIIGKVVSEPYEYKDSIGCDIDFGNNDIYNEYEMYQSIIKSSPKIIDLIEVGDVITTNNLCGEITKIDGDKIYTTCYDGEYCSASDIKTIVTKECFKSMEYKVEE